MSAHAGAGALVSGTSVSFRALALRFISAKDGIMVVVD
jgi:hypothetical protein